jgi:hypothetical protein
VVGVSLTCFCSTFFMPSPVGIVLKVGNPRSIFGALCFIDPLSFGSFFSSA